MIPTSEVSSSTSSLAALKTYATINQGTSANTLWYDIKTLRWVVEPGEFIKLFTINAHPKCLASALKLLIIPVVLYINWEFFAPFFAKDLPNPFSPLIFISHYIPNSLPDDPRYAKGYLDLLFVVYYIIFFSFARQTIMISLCRPLAQYFGIRKPAKIDRYGEQGYALVYFGLMGAWGFVGSCDHIPSCA
jgi:acyl-CoA-dependent ceramide synthase